MTILGWYLFVGLGGRYGNVLCVRGDSECFTCRHPDSGWESGWRGR